MSASGLRKDGVLGALPFLLAVALIHLVIAWPGAGSRGIIAEEIQPYLRHYPKVLELRGGDVNYLPPNDDPELRSAVDEGREVEPRWVGTRQWPEVGYQGRERVVPVFVRGHQTAIGSLWGVGLGPLLGGGIAGVRRSSVLMGLCLLMLVWGLGRRLGLSRGFATAAAIGCALSPGLWFFTRTGLAFEHASRVFMLLALFFAASLSPLSRARSVAIGATFALAVLCRATVAATLGPVLLLMLLDARRFAGPPRMGLTLAIGGGAPIALVGLALLLLPFASGTAPGATLEIDKLAGRTLIAPIFAAHQLAWVIDPRVILQRIAEGDLRADPGLVRPLLAGVVVVAALVRWWQARAGEAERIFVCGLLGNALVGSWLYGDPLQFQLGMALEPLFVLALVYQVSELYQARARIGVGVLSALLVARAFTLLSLFQSERRTDNPMLSGVAQRSLVEELRAQDVRGDELITTTYNHVGVIEGWTDESLRPIHAWRALQKRDSAGAGADGADRSEPWVALLDAHPACFVLLTRAPTLYEGPFTDVRAVAEGLERALIAQGRRIERRRIITGDGGGPVFELVEIAPCRRDKNRGLASL